MDIEKTVKQLQLFDEAYFEGSPLVTDTQYDLLKESLRKESPDHPYLLEVGSPERGGKIPLPYKMGSLDQIYENDYVKWIKKYSIENSEVVVSEKLDGMSVLLVYETVNGKLSLQNAYSRGNGLEGADITRHIKVMPSTPVSMDRDDIERIVIRAEVIMEEELFQSKYSTDNKNSRNMVSGCMNRKVTKHSILKDIHLVTYEIVDLKPKDNKNTKKDNLKLLKDLGFLVVNNKTFLGNELNDEKLKELYTSMADESLYLLDGIVITINDYATMKKLSKSSSINPEHSVKYKNISDEHILETIVKKVHWKLSKSGYYKPRVEITPVNLFGTTVTFATGFNGKFIVDNGIGSGSKIKITKAGAVIPYIVEVLEKVEPMLPEAEWEWDSLGVEMRSTEDTPDVIFMQAVHFFKTLSVEQLQETSLKKVYDSLLDSKINISTFDNLVSEVISLLDHDMKKILGANGLKAYDSLHKRLSEIKPETLLGATPFFGQGFGVRKAKKIIDVMSFENFLTCSESDIKRIEGFDKTSSRVVDGIEAFKDFYNNIEDYVTFASKEEIPLSNKLNGHVVVMTGFRNKELQEKIEQYGGKVTSGVSKKTTIVIAEDVNSSSSKIKKAKELNIPVIGLNDFEYTYIL